MCWNPDGARELWSQGLRSQHKNIAGAAVFLRLFRAVPNEQQSQGDKYFTRLVLGFKHPYRNRFGQITSLSLAVDVP